MAKYNYTMHLERNNEKKTHTFVVETPEDYREVHLGGEIHEIAVCLMPDWIADESWEIADSEYTEAKLTAKTLAGIFHEEFQKGCWGKIDPTLFQYVAQSDTSAQNSPELRELLEAVVARINKLV